MNDLMVDLETAGNGSNAAIVSIGACFFDISSGEIGEQFKINIDLVDAAKYGYMDAATIKWWLSQDKEAQAVFNDSGSTTLVDALNNFNLFISNNSNAKYLKVWGNGSGFDNVILRNAYQACNMQACWQFWNDRDVRTIVDLGKALAGVDPKKIRPFEGVKHDALADAIHQAKYVSDIYQALKGV